MSQLVLYLALRWCVTDKRCQHLLTRVYARWIQIPILNIHNYACHLPKMGLLQKTKRWNIRILQIAFWKCEKEWVGRGMENTEITNLSLHCRLRTGRYIMGLSENCEPATADLEISRSATSQAVVWMSKYCLQWICHI